MIFYDLKIYSLFDCQFVDCINHLFLILSELNPHHVYNSNYFFDLLLSIQYLLIYLY